jgi:predicted RND superfamily exporter protein
MSHPKKGVAFAVSKFITDKPWLTLAISFVTMAALSMGLGKMTVNFTHTAFFRDTDPARQRFEAFERQFGNDDAVIVVVHSPSGIFDKESTELMRKLTERMWRVPEVIRVDSLTNFQWVHAEGDEIEIEPLLPREGDLSPQLLEERKQIALKHEVLPDYLISKDAKTAVIYAKLKPGIEHPPDAPLITAETEKVVADLKGGDHVFHLTGGPIVNNAFKDSSQKDLSVLVPALLGMVALLLAFTFRRVGGVVMPFLVIFTTVIAAFSFSGWLGLEMSTVTFSLPQVLIAVSVAESVHLLVGFYRARKASRSRREAAQYTLQKNFMATLLTSSTTAIGFYSFISANLPPIEYFGILAGLGTTYTWLMTYGVVGPLMVVWPGKEPTTGADTIEDDLTQSTPFTRGYIGFIDRYRWAVIVLFIGLVSMSYWLSLKNVVNSNPYEYFREGLPVRTAQEFVLDNLGGVAQLELVVNAGKEDGIKEPEFLRKVEELEKRIVHIPGMNRTISIVDILRQMNRALNGGNQADYKLPATKEGVAQELLLYTMGLPQGMDVNDRMTVKNDALRITVVSTITDSNSAVAAAEQVERIGKELGIDVKATGKMLLYQGMNSHVVDSFLNSLGSALLLIGFIMVVSFRSLKLGLISMVPNIVPLVFGGAVLYFISGTLDIGTVLVASVSLGIAVDDTIHILTHFNKHREDGMTTRESLERLMAHSGPAMLSTTVILVTGFLTLAFGDFIPNVYFGLLTAIILALGLATDFVLLPAILMTAMRDKVPASTPAFAKVAGDLAEVEQ